LISNSYTEATLKKTIHYQTFFVFLLKIKLAFRELTIIVNEKSAGKPKSVQTPLSVGA
jgi:hypothetical protein